MLPQNSQYLPCFLKYSQYLVYIVYIIDHVASDNHTRLPRSFSLKASSWRPLSFTQSCSRQGESCLGWIFNCSIIPPVFHWILSVFEFKSFNHISWSSLRISIVGILESRDLERFHSIEQYPVSRPPYFLKWFLWFFLCFSAKSRFFQVKNTHFWKFRSHRLSPPPYLRTIHKKNPLNKRLSRKKSP